jgi:hypothetical protein
VGQIDLKVFLGRQETKGQIKKTLKINKEEGGVSLAIFLYSPNEICNMLKLPAI